MSAARRNSLHTDVNIKPDHATSDTRGRWPKVQRVQQTHSVHPVAICNGIIKRAQNATNSFCPHNWARTAKWILHPHPSSPHPSSPHTASTLPHPGAPHPPILGPRGYPTIFETLGCPTILGTDDYPISGTHDSRILGTPD